MPNSLQFRVYARTLAIENWCPPVFNDRIVAIPQSRHLINMLNAQSTVIIVVATVLVVPERWQRERWFWPFCHSQMWTAAYIPDDKATRSGMAPRRKRTVAENSFNQNDSTENELIMILQQRWRRVGCRHAFQICWWLCQHHRQQRVSEFWTERTCR